MTKQNKWLPLLDFYKTLGKASLFLVPWIYCVHEVSHYLACIALGGNGAIYHFWPPSVYCNITGTGIVGVSIAPYLVGLIALFFVRTEWVRLAIMLDGIANFIGSINSQGDFTNILRVSATWYFLCLTIVLATFSFLVAYYVTKTRTWQKVLS